MLKYIYPGRPNNIDRLEAQKQFAKTQILCFILCCCDGLNCVPTPQSHVETLTPKLAIFGNKAFQEVT